MSKQDYLIAKADRETARAFAVPMAAAAGAPAGVAAGNYAAKRIMSKPLPYRNGYPRVGRFLARVNSAVAAPFVGAALGGGAGAGVSMVATRKRRTTEG